MSILQRILLYLVLPLMLMTGTAQSKHEGSYLNDIDTDYVTPHLNWGRPLSGGSIKAFFVVPRRAAREVVEIWQRMDLKFESFVCFHSGLVAQENVYEGAVEGTSVYEKEQEILKKLETNYDVFIFGHASFDILPAEAKYRILKQVKDGAGLVFFYNHGTQYKKLFSHPVPLPVELTKSIAPSGLPLALQKMSCNSLIKGYRVGKGMVVAVDYPGKHSTYYSGLSLTQKEDHSQFWTSVYENSMVLVGRSFETEKNISQDSIQKTPAHLSFTGKRRLRSKIVIRLRDEWNDIVLTKNFRASFSAGGKRSIDLRLPFLKAGRYYIDFLINTRGGTDNFGFVTFKVDSSAGSITLETDKPYYEKGETIKGKASFEKKVEGGGSVVLSLLDSPYGNIWKEYSYPFKESENTIDFTVDPGVFPTIAGYLRCEIKSAQGTVARKENLLFFPDRQQEIFPSFVWGGIDGYFPHLYLPQIKKAGFNASLNHPTAGGENAKTAALFNVKFVPYMYRVMLGKDEKGWTQEGWLKTADTPKYNGDGSFYNPTVQQEAKKVITTKMENLPVYGPLVYTLGDENHFTYEGGYSPSEMKEFRRYLERKYKEIAVLNREWETSFSSFKEVPRYSLEELRKNHRFAAWYDNGFFMEKQYGDYHHFLSEVIKGIDPYARVGAEGSVPGSLEYTIDKLEFWGPYDNRVMDEVLRSLGSDRLRTSWWGGYTGSHGGRDVYPYPLWRQLLCNTVNGNSWYTSGPSSEGMLTTSLSFARFFKEMLPRLQKLNDGAAHLLIKSGLKKDGIAIHWSHTSYSASKMDDRFFNPENSIGSFISYCYRQGLNFDFITTEMVEGGKLKDYRIFFLFGSSSITEKEREMINRFVKNGGVVVADLNPGILNGYCRHIKTGMLNDIFNTPELRGEEKFSLMPVKVKSVIKGRDIEFKAEGAMISPEVKAFSVNNIGDGTAILLNFNLGSAENSVLPGYSFDRFISEILAIAGISPSITVEGIQDRVRLIVRVRDTGSFSIAGLLAGKDDIGRKIDLTFDRPFYIYGVGGGHLGHGRRLSLRIDEPFMLYSLFETEQKSPVVKIENSSIKRGDSFNIQLQGISDERVCRIEVSDSKGNETYKKIVFVNKDSKNLQIPVAFNQRTGYYALKVIDVATGLSTTIRVRVI